MEVESPETVDRAPLVEQGLKFGMERCVSNKSSDDPWFSPRGILSSQAQPVFQPAPFQADTVDTDTCHAIPDDVTQSKRRHLCRCRHLRVLHRSSQTQRRVQQCPGFTTEEVERRQGISSQTILNADFGAWGSSCFIRHVLRIFMLYYICYQKAC